MVSGRQAPSVARIAPVSEQRKVQLFGTKVDDATVDGPDVGIRLTVLQADRWNAEPGGGQHR